MHVYSSWFFPGSSILQVIWGGWEGWICLFICWMVGWLIVLLGFFNLSGSCHIFYSIGKDWLLAVGVQAATLSSLVAAWLRRSELQPGVSRGVLLSMGNVEMLRITWRTLSISNRMKASRRKFVLILREILSSYSILLDYIKGLWGAERCLELL